MTRRVPIATAATLLIAATLFAACKDGPSSPATARAQQGHAMMASSAGGSVASVTIPPAGGFSSVVLSRGGFRDDVNVMVRLKYERETMVSQADESGDVVFARVTFQPGGALPWHTHPGPAIVSVVSGELTLVRAEGCTVLRYPAGSAFVDPGQGMVHVGFNGGSTEVVLNVTYLGVPPGTSPLMPVANPGC